jgi:arylsulfatase A-like enzyme
MNILYSFCVSLRFLRPLLLGSLAATPVAAADRPNVVFLLADDMRWDMMGCAGNRIIQTPHLDALARGGVRFPNAFVTTAICAASRASLLTGLYERTHRYTFGTNPYWKKQPDGTEKHLTDIEGEQAVEFLAAQRPGVPFCLSVSFNAPHAEDNDPKQYFWQKEVDHLYRDVTFPVPRTMAPDFFEKHPPFLKDTESRVRFKWRFDEPKKYQEMVAGYYRMISGVDLVVGRIREALAKKGLAENTVIVFSADNGYFLGDRGFADKWYVYEHSIRVPLIVYDPRAKSPRVVDRMALNVDVSPTLLELAGVPVPAAVQGHSLVPLLRGEAPADWRTDFFYEHLFERKNIPKSEGVRTERHTYVRWFEQSPVVEELYDHVADFDQTTNLVADPAHAAVLERLRKRTTELRDKYGGPYRPNPAEPGRKKK